MNLGKGLVERTCNTIANGSGPAGSGSAYIKTQSDGAALIVLSGDSLLVKYGGFFKFYAVHDREKALITHSVLRSLLTDLNQIPAIVGESCALSCVEIATQSCFCGDLNTAILEEKILSWLRSEPTLLLWLPTCYRLSATKMVYHQVRCSVGKNFPITGFRYCCLKCLNFDLCQDCFFTGPLKKPRWRYTKKLFNKLKDKVQFLHNCQEDKSCKIEAKLQRLIASHENLQMRLQQVKQEVKYL